MSLRLFENQEWLAIVTQLLDGTESERRRAHEVLWVQVSHFVIEVARLRIGPLGDDLDVRRDVAVDVMCRLMRRDCEQVQLWRATRRHNGDTGAWWSFVATLAQTAAIDAARTCRQRLSRRGEPYRFANEVPLESTDFLKRGTEPDIAEYLISVIDLRREAAKKMGSGDGEQAGELTNGANGTGTGEHAGKPTNGANGNGHSPRPKRENRKGDGGERGE